MTSTTTDTRTTGSDTTARAVPQNRLDADDMATIRAVVANSSPMLGNVALRRQACAAIGRTWCEMRDIELYVIDELVHEAIAASRRTGRI